MRLLPSITNVLLATSLCLTAASLCLTAFFLLTTSLCLHGEPEDHLLQDLRENSTKSLLKWMLCKLRICLHQG